MIRLRSKQNIETAKKRASLVLFAACYALIFFLSYAPACFPEGEAGSYGTPDKSLNGYLSKAGMYYKSGKYQEAVSAWHEVLEFDPNNTEAIQGINDAEKKIAKITDFFGSTAFQEAAESNVFSLEDCIDVAASNSIPLEVAGQQIKLAQMKVWEARRAFLPSLTLSWTRTSGIQAGGKVEGIEYGVEGKQPAFHSGSILYGLAQARAGLTVAEGNYGKTRNEMYFEVAKSYYALIKAKKEAEFAEDVFGEMKPFYEIAKKEYEKTVTPTIEFINVESNFNQMYYQVISNDNEFKLAKLDLEQKLSVEDMGNIDIPTAEDAKIVNKDMESCLELALENRPDLKAGFYTVKYTEYGKKIADAKEMPTVDLVGNYKKSSEVFRESYNPANVVEDLDPHKKWYVGLEANWPFLGSTAGYSYFQRHDPAALSTFQPDSESKGTTLKLDVLNNIKNFSEIEEAKIANLRAEQDFEDARKKVVMEVKEAFYGYEKARVQMEASKAQIEFREKEFAILRFKNSMGENELSELFDSVIKLLDANTLYCEAEASLNISVAALNRAIGIEDYF